MKYKCEQHLSERDYEDARERITFRIGYDDGYFGYPIWFSNKYYSYPNVYSAGYWEGFGDRHY